MMSPSRYDAAPQPTTAGVEGHVGIGTPYKGDWCRPYDVTSDAPSTPESVSYTHLTLPTNREV